MTVTIHTIAKDEWKAGDYVVCDKCGCHLRHYAKTAGATYGLDCAKSLGLIGKKMTAKKMKHISWQIDSFKRMYEEKTAKDDIIYSWARQIDIALGLNIPNSKNYSDLIFETIK